MVFNQQYDVFHFLFLSRKKKIIFVEYLVNRTDSSIELKDEENKYHMWFSLNETSILTITPYATEYV